MLWLSRFNILFQKERWAKTKPNRCKLHYAKRRSGLHPLQSFAGGWVGTVTPPQRPGSCPPVWGREQGVRAPPPSRSPETQTPSAKAHTTFTDRSHDRPSKWCRALCSGGLTRGSKPKGFERRLLRQCFDLGEKEAPAKFKHNFESVSFMLLNLKFDFFI